MTLPSKARSGKLRTEKVDKRITINVSGRRYCTRDSTLKKYPNTLLGSEAIKLYFDDDKKEYFLDRDPHMFRYILNFYRDGKLHYSYDDCLGAFHEELRFYGIDMDNLSECCWEECYNLSNKMCPQNQEPPKCAYSELRRDKSFLRKWFWNLLENTETTRLGKCVQSFIGVLIYRVVCAIIETEWCCKDKTCEEKYPRLFFVLDAFCMSIFTVEYILRLYASDHRLKFIANKMNIVDLLAVAPFYVILLFKHLSPGSSSAVENASGLMVLRMLRVFRIFKLSRHSRHMRHMGRALKRAVVDLGFLFAFLLANIIFSSVLYFVEQMNAEETKFKSIPDSMWYTVITMMTVG
ncbi:hypothetical protein OS493_025201 [Desmophyllum pertusum]|uniref:BTB domain-containing protein n=1 Tax=Desmophyllum pertusum TaxID=174260 RepID=A0A9X0D1N7_9CNID|nr:hypothetical protein OS493_025201 [Desmophyllum pertusum]